MAFALTLLASITLVLSLVLVGRATPGYGHVRDTISELGARGAPHQKLVAVGVFLPVGLLLLAAAGVARTASQPVALLALAIAIGYLVAAAFPCDPGAPSGGSPRNVVHNIGGAVEYVGGAYALEGLSASLGSPYRIAAVAVIVALVGVSFAHPLRGLVQRVAEAILFGGLAHAAFAMARSG